MKQEASPASHARNAIALDALQDAREMRPGAPRADALKAGGFVASRSKQFDRTLSLIAALLVVAIILIARY
jgi:hypothetical protein